MKFSSHSPCDLPLTAFTASQVRELDERAIESGIAPVVLMKRAGRAAFELMLLRWPELTDEGARVSVFVGSGNNGGDGYVLAALAASRNILVEVVQVAGSAKSDAANKAQAFAQQEQVPVITLEQWQQDSEGLHVIVDGLLGSGLSGAVRGPFLDAIALINESELPVLALDLPSGLCADTGAALGCAVKATSTISFIGLKQGTLTGEGLSCSGELAFSDLDVVELTKPATVESNQPGQPLLNLADLLSQLPELDIGVHKGHLGHALVVGGDFGYGGAIAIASEMTARSGAGLISAATRPEHISALISRRPEVMALPVNSGQELTPYLERASVVAIGPGLGRSPWSEQLLQSAFDSQKPMVVDADGLNILAEARVCGEAPYRDDWVLTPHPGEAARLLGLSVEQVQSDRFSAAKNIAQRFGGVCILKGAGTVVATAQDTWLSISGNPGMASGGMGDLLTGLLAGLLAQGLALEYVAKLAVELHNGGADLMAEELGQRSLLATDVMLGVQTLLAAAEE